ncbi:hypothetical protein H310_09835 [Aphanomyces invadans]|uniref:BolA protein n=1 Tax=Aphanomyces invadans TaxID=157072 RepID=A0A024TUJ1_9STRA|nr:hypothetical protein H310_09835 [Aphanomyces invadans]ETV96987.1 hypothetical protein H310_09835 [Aphanomyces invadans]RHY28793.1 hypothetical protein DYB32_005702 [Aphanomyces invadans]|eukprot:XP_008874233.1 hypothetical protein H310_09835 [Aphanomyces invadans]
MMLRRSGRVATLAAVRSFATTAEESMRASLLKALDATHVQVDDISGGCGSMYKIEVVSPAFEGKSRVAQHRLVNEVIKEEIGGMHGLTVKTWTPAQYKPAA